MALTTFSSCWGAHGLSLGRFLQQVAARGGRRRRRKRLGHDLAAVSVEAKDGLVDLAQRRLWCRAVEELQINFEKEISKNVESSAAMLPQNPMQKMEESRRMPKKFLIKRAKNERKCLGHGSDNLQ